MDDMKKWPHITYEYNHLTRSFTHTHTHIKRTLVASVFSLKIRWIQTLRRHTEMDRLGISQTPSLAETQTTDREEGKQREGKESGLM